MQLLYKLVTLFRRQKMSEHISSVQTIVLTGGPCAGKTTMLNFLGEWLIKQGIIPIFIDETATRLQKNGIRPDTGHLGIDGFEKILLRMQLRDEDFYSDVAWEIAESTGKKVVIIQDRSIIDIAAYIGIENLKHFLKDHNKELSREANKYSSVIHLQTAANGAIHAYTLANNTARRETPEEAREKDTMVYMAYINAMPEGRVFYIKNNGGFQRKKLDTVNALNDILGLPLIGESQRKFLIALSNIEKIKAKYGGTVISIEQIYLHGTELFKGQDAERRIRKFSDGEHCFYSISNTTYSEDLKERIKTEKMLTESEYKRLMKEADWHHFRVINKKRICFLLGEQYIEIDVFENPHLPYGILEVKSLQEEAREPQIKGLGAEVTGKSAYLNRYIASIGA